MMINHPRTTSAVLLAASMLLGSGRWLTCQAGAAEPADPAPLAKEAESEEALSERTFVRYHTRIKPQAGESRWLEVPWLVDLHAARQKAAAEGKPLFVYSAGGATGIGAC